MVPNSNESLPINSSAIQFGWYPSSIIASVDITRLNGTCTISASAGYRLMTYSSSVTFPLTKLNESGRIIITGLQANTIYIVRFQKSCQENGTGNSYSVAPFPKLLRTYAINQTTLNPLPQVGTYSWKQIVNSAGKTAVLVNASVSLELPYIQRNITVTFGSENQSSALNLSTEFATFQFDQLDSQPKNYPLEVVYTLLDGSDTSVFSGYKETITRSETVRITPTTTPHGTGNRLSLLPIFYLAILTMLFFM